MQSDQGHCYSLFRQLGYFTRMRYIGFDVRKPDFIACKQHTDQSVHLFFPGKYSSQSGSMNFFQISS